MGRTSGCWPLLDATGSMLLDANGSMSGLLSSLLWLLASLLWLLAELSYKGGGPSSGCWPSVHRHFAASVWGNEVDDNLLAIVFLNCESLGKKSLQGKNEIC